MADAKIVIALEIVFPSAAPAGLTFNACFAAKCQWSRLSDVPAGLVYPHYLLLHGTFAPFIGQSYAFCFSLVYMVLEYPFPSSIWHSSLSSSRQRRTLCFDFFGTGDVVDFLINMLT